MVQGIPDDEVPWAEYVISLTVGTWDMAVSLAKCLLAIWRWSIKVQGQDVCPPAPTALNIGQFMTCEQVLENVDNSLWFTAYSHTLQRVGEAMCSRCWQWARGKAMDIEVSPLVRVFWEETGIELAASCIKLCWELPPWGVFRRRERGTVFHAITFMDDMAMHIPTLDIWDQFVWPPAVAMPRAATEVEQYGYHWGHAVDLSPVMPVSQFKVTDEAGTYLCAARALVFEGSVLAYNPTRDKAEWVPACGVIMKDLSWTEEKSAVVLANYVPCISQEAACIAGLGTRCLMSWPDDSSSEEENDGQMEEEDNEGEEEEDPADMEEQGEVGPELPSGSKAPEQGKTEQEVEPQG